MIINNIHRCNHCGCEMEDNNGAGFCSSYCNSVVQKEKYADKIAIIKKKKSIKRSKRRVKLKGQRCHFKSFAEGCSAPKTITKYNGITYSEYCKTQ